MTERPLLQQQEGLQQSIREKCAWVAGQAAFVKIRIEKIPEYTEALLNKYPLITQMSPECHLIDSKNPEQTALYILALDSINFSSGYFAEAKRAGIRLEYETIAGGLKNAFLSGEWNAAEKLEAITAEDCHRVFSIPKGKSIPLDYLMMRFAAHLNAAGKNLVQHYQSSALELADAASGSAVALVNIVSAWPTFRDVCVYKGVEIPFLKRAQILAADLHLALQGKAPADFKDMEQLTIFADNMVPHVLRYDGILEYTPALLTRIERGELLTAGSEEEIEIRAVAVHAVELMKQAALAKGHHVTAVNLDHILWNRGYAPDIYARPSHRTMTECY